MRDRRLSCLPRVTNQSPLPAPRTWPIATAKSHCNCFSNYSPRRSFHVKPTWDPCSLFFNTVDHRCGYIGWWHGPTGRFGARMSGFPPNIRAIERSNEVLFQPSQLSFYLARLRHDGRYGSRLYAFAAHVERLFNRRSPRVGIWREMRGIVRQIQFWSCRSVGVAGAVTLETADGRAIHCKKRRWRRQRPIRERVFWRPARDRQTAGSLIPVDS